MILRFWNKANQSFDGDTSKSNIGNDFRLKALEFFQLKVIAPLLTKEPETILFFVGLLRYMFLVFIGFYMVFLMNHYGDGFGVQSYVCEN